MAKKPPIYEIVLAKKAGYCKRKIPRQFWAPSKVRSGAKDMAVHQNSQFQREQKAGCKLRRKSDAEVLLLLLYKGIKWVSGPL